MVVGDVLQEGSSCKEGVVEKACTFALFERLNRGLVRRVRDELAILWFTYSISLLKCLHF